VGIGKAMRAEKLISSLNWLPAYGDEARGAGFQG
jgi:hypothetical protein